MATCFWRTSHGVATVFCPENGRCICLQRVFQGRGQLTWLLIRFVRRYKPTGGVFAVKVIDLDHADEEIEDVQRVRRSGLPTEVVTCHVQPLYVLTCDC